MYLSAVLGVVQMFRKQLYVMQYIPVVFLFCMHHYRHYPSTKQFQSFHAERVYINQHFATQQELV